MKNLINGELWPDTRSRCTPQLPMSSPVLAVQWRGNQLDLIDQRKLPIYFETVHCTTAVEVATAIRDMVVRGAPAIGCSAAFGIALEARLHAKATLEVFHAALGLAFTQLAASRPTAVNLFWALDRMRKTLAELPVQQDPAHAADQLALAALAIFNDDLAGNHAMGNFGAELIPDGARVLTHCNAGALATAGHGTALGVIRSARDQGKRISVIANETRPLLQGARLTAWELAEEKIPVSLATDSMAGYLMRAGKIDLVIVGADRIASNGDTANKIGTYTMAVLAQHHGIPFYVAAPLSTIDMASSDGSAIPIEQRSPEEVTGCGNTRWAPTGIDIINPAFDVTPARYLSALITEYGVLHKPDSNGLHRLFQQQR